MNTVLQLLRARLTILEQNVNPAESYDNGDTGINPQSFPYVSLENIEPGMNFQFDPQCVIVFSPEKQSTNLFCNNQYVNEMIASLFDLQPLQDLYASSYDEYFSKTYDGVQLVVRRDETKVQIAVRHAYVRKENEYWLQITYLKQGVINMLALNKSTWGLIRNPMLGTVYLPMWIKTLLQLWKK